MENEKPPEMPKDTADEHDSWQKALEEEIARGDDARLLPDTVSTDEFVRVEQATLIDAKTGLPNGVAFKRKLDQFCASHTSGALVIMDLNGLKVINDEMGGHRVGDHALITVAKELQLNTSKSDFVARMNGTQSDEFAVLFPDLPKEKLPVVLTRLQAMFSGGFDAQDHLIPTVSIGAAHTDDLGDARIQYLKDCADYAMYQAKQQARHSPSITESNKHLGTKYAVRKPTMSYMYNPSVDGPVLTVKDALALLQVKPNDRLK